MARLVSGGKILNDGTFQRYDKASGNYVDIVSNELDEQGNQQNLKVDEDNFGSTAVGGTTEYSGDNLQALSVLNADLRGPDVSVPGEDQTPRVVSSDTPMNQRDSQDAMNQAGNALTTSPGGLSPYEQNYLNIAGQNQTQAINSMQDQFDAIDAVYDAQLGRVNQQYSNQMQDLKQSFQQQKGMAEQQAAALNPYSEAQGAMTARNFTGAIENQYQKQASRLQEAATIAQNELAAGRTKNYMEINQAMQESNRQFKKEMAGFLLDAQRNAQAAQQADRQYDLNVAQFGLQQDRFALDQQETAQSQFMDFVGQFNQDPNFKASLNDFYQTGEVSEGLQPLIDKGLAAGYSSPEEILAVAQYETTQQRQFQQQQDLNWYQAKTARMRANNVGGGGVQTNTQETGETNEILSRALTQALAGSGMTDTQRGFVVQLANQQGLDGLFSWAANNKFSATERDAYKQYGTSADTLSYVSDQLETAETTFGPYKNLAEVSKPWLAMQRDPEYTELAQSIEVAQAQIRRGFYGTAVTDSEKSTANRFLINPNDDFESVKIKVRNLANIMRFANDKNAAQALGVGDEISIRNYLEAETPEKAEEKRQSQNVQWGLPNSTATNQVEISDDEIGEFLNTL